MDSSASAELVCYLPEGVRLFEAIEDHVIPQVKLRLDNPTKEEVCFLSVEAPPPPCLMFGCLST